MNYTEHNQNRGFTVVELMIATAVFSILLLLALAGFLQIGQLFYKGVNITRSTDAANQIISGIKDDISFDNSTMAISPQSSTINVGGVGTVTRWHFCAGQNRYIYIPGKRVDTDDKDSGATSGWHKFGIIKESGFTTTGCPGPNAVPINAANATELLGDNMRLANLTIQPVLGSLYTVDVRIAYGIDEVLTNPPSATDVKCSSGANNARYCFITDFRTTVRRGLTP